MNSQRMKSWYTRMCRWLILISSALAIICLFLRRVYKVKWLNNYIYHQFIKRQQKSDLMNYYLQIITGSSSTENLTDMINQRKTFGVQLALEILTLCIFPYPFFDLFIQVNVLDENSALFNVIHYLGDFFFAFMFVRLFFLVRTLDNLSLYTSAFSKQICKNYGFSSGVKFSVRAYFYMHPARCFAFTFFFSMFFLAYLIRIAELPYYREIDKEV